MGYILRGDISTAYRRIRRDAAHRTASILILAAPTVDSLCALKILTELFKCDLLPFKVVPVSGYDDIVAANDNFIQGRDEIRSVILLDCGGTVDLAELISVAPTMTVYVFDSHRPYSLFNLFGNSQLFVIDDGFVEDSLERLQQAYDATTFDDEDDDDQDDGDDDDDGRLNETVAYRRLCEDRYREYYAEGSWYGSSIARLMFDLADSLGHDCNDHLWSAILGVTFQYMMEFCSPAVYAAEVSFLRERCLQLNKSADDLSLVPDSSVWNSKTSSSSNQQQQHLARSSSEGRNADGGIFFDAEFRFMLTRHWTLFDSMLHSRYMATRLAVWRDKGKRMLETFIVKMGIPLAQCKLDYSSMESNLKDSLSQRIARHAADFGIADISFPSFVRSFGFVMRLSASDAVYALMALIEAPLEVDSSTSCTADTGNLIKAKQDLWIRNFFSALDALDYFHIDILKRGIHLAMRQQQVVLHEASDILSHRLLRYGRRFRHVVLRHSEELAWLASHPLALMKLALFLAQATGRSRRGNTPLVLAAYQKHNDTYLVIAANGSSSHQASNGNLDEDSVNHLGVMGGDEAGHAAALGFVGGLAIASADHNPMMNGRYLDGEEDDASIRNRFGIAFRKVAQQMNVRVKHDGFESSMIEVKSDDLRIFLQTLQTVSI